MTSALRPRSNKLSFPTSDRLVSGIFFIFTPCLQYISVQQIVIKQVFPKSGDTAHVTYATKTLSFPRQTLAISCHMFSEVVSLDSNYTLVKQED